MSATGENTNPAAPAPEQPVQQNTGTAAPNTTDAANSTNPNSVTSPAQSNQNDDDLATLDRVYDEVMRKNNKDILKTFSKQKLGYIRNTLFAKKGYIFTKSREYADYFSKKSWYNGRYNTDEILNPEEKKFVLIIKEYEK